MNKLNKFYKKVSIVACLMLVLAMVSGVITTQVKAKGPSVTGVDSPVELYSAKINTFRERGIIQGYNAKGYVAIDHADPSGTLTIHYSYEEGSWTTVEGKFLGMANGEQLWSFATERIDPSFHYYNFPCKFAAQYKVNGKVYWDNNNGNDYFLRMTNVPTYDRKPFLLNKSKVRVTNARQYTNNGITTFKGRVVVDNLSYEKDIKVVYSTDNWKTVNKVSARYEQSYDNGVEIWGFTANDLPADSTIDYFVTYTDTNGKTHIDSNFQRNYKLK